MSDRTRDWMQFQWGFPVVSSPSALDRFLSCPRKWWFEKSVRMPGTLLEPARLVMGNVLHECVERWLQADECGYGPDGNPIEMFPDGWDDELSLADAAMVRVLVQKAIDSGMVVRSPGREVEAPFQLTPLPNASIVGFIDLLSPGMITDHKSAKSRRYALSADALANDPQMMIYAGVALARDPSLEQVILRHNYYVKDPKSPMVFPVEKAVSASQVERYWQENILPALRSMVDFKSRFGTAEEWEEVEGPRVKGICNKYGGCAFSGICTKTQTVDDYRAEIDRANAQLIEANGRTSETDMGLFDKLEKKQAAATSATKTEAPAPEPEETKNVASTEPTDEAQSQREAVAETETEASSDPADVGSGSGVASVAPWGVPDCRACEGRGISSKGGPCRACDAWRTKNGGPRSNGYKLEATDGAVRVLDADGNEVAVVPTSAEVTSRPAPTPKAAETKQQESKPEPASEQSATEHARDEASESAPASSPGKASPLEPTAEKTKETKRRNGGRPRKGFTLLRGAMLKRGSTNVFDAHMLFERYSSELAEAVGAESYYQMDTWRRREALAAKAEPIAETLGSGILVYTSGTPDLDYFVNALEPYADTVILGVLHG